MSGLISLGSAVLDRLAGVGAEAERQVVGGAALNVAVGARRQGVPTILIAAVADDEAGAVIRTLADAEGLRLIDAGGERATTIATSRRAGGTVEYRFSSTVPSGLLRFDSAVLAQLCDAAVVVMSAMRAGEGDGLDRLVGALRGSSALRIYDPNPRVREGDSLASHRREIERIVAACDLVKLASEDLRLLYPGENPRELIDRLLRGGARAVLVTHGADGASLHSPDIEVRMPSRILSEDVLDPMGAGDAVTASLSASLYGDGWPADREGWTRVLERAMLAAAIVCGRLGAAEAMPDRAVLDGGVR